MTKGLILLLIIIALIGYCGYRMIQDYWGLPFEDEDDNDAE